MMEVVVALDRHLLAVITPGVVVAGAMETVATATAASAILTLEIRTVAMEGVRTAIPLTVMAEKADTITTVTNPAEEVAGHLVQDQTEGTVMMTIKTLQKL